MSTISRKIQLLRSQLKSLEAAQEREERENRALEDLYNGLKESLAKDEISFDSFIRFCYRDVRKVVTRIEKEKAKAVAPKKGTTKKKRGGRRKASAKKAAPTVKIQPGRYTNIPPETDKMFVIGEKGARPKAVKAYALEIGEEKFLEQCRIDD